MPRKFYTILLIALALAAGAVLMGKYNPKRFIFYGDVMGYYIYLPSAIIYHNLQDMDKLPANAGIEQGVFEYTAFIKKYNVEAGLEHWLNQYTYAVALMELPFFLAAHLYETVAGRPANGYDDSYKLALSAGSIMYTLLGMILVYKVLRRYFSHMQALVTLILVLLGTNMFWFAFGQAGMSHIPLFFLYALLMYVTIRLHEKPGTGWFIVVGLIAGFITVMRPSDVVCLAIPFLYGVSDKASLMQKLQFVKVHRYKLLMAAIFFILPAIPQMLYWKLVTGSYIYYSYGGQAFNWANPKLVEGLFSSGNGWLPYAPVMLFALAGLMFYKSLKDWKLVIVVILPVYIYIIYSWYCYNYINGFGSRPMLHLYPLLSLPLASFIQYISRKSVATKAVFAVACLLCVCAVLSLSYLQAQKKYASDNANYRFYLQMLFKTRLTYEDMLVAEMNQFQPDVKSLTSLRTYAYKDFNLPLDDHYVSDPLDTAEYVYHVRDGEEYFPGKIQAVYKQSDFKDVNWIRCSGRFMIPGFSNYQPHLFVFAVQDDSNNYVYWTSCKIDNKIGVADNSCVHAGGTGLSFEHTEYDRWGEVYFFVKVPDGLNDGNIISLDIWNTGKVQFYLDDFKIGLYR